MFIKYKKISYYPAKPLLIWDGDCGFCKYWMLRWQNLTGNSVKYEPYQKIADEIIGIPKSAFKEAIRLIEPDGTVYNGPHAAYRALTYSNKWTKLSKKYNKNSFFRFMSDHAYVFIAKHRRALFFFTKLVWGKNPNSPKKYWILYLSLFILIITLIMMML